MTATNPKGEEKKLSEDLLNLAGSDQQKTCIANPDRELTNTANFYSLLQEQGREEETRWQSSIKSNPVIERTGKQEKY